MDERMAGVARMLFTARPGQEWTIARGPDGVVYWFQIVDGSITARPCLD
jgi:hypothetical protein